MDGIRIWWQNHAKATKQTFMVMRMFNTALRLGSLGLKLLLILYMGKYMGLAEMGTYGLVAAIVTVMIPLLGLRIDYIVGREIVTAAPGDLTAKLRDQAVVFGLNYLLLIVACAMLLLSPYDGFDNKILVFTLGLSILESIAAVAASNLVSLGKPVLSNALFFIRSSAWVVPVVTLGYFYPSLRTAEFIFAFWLGGVLVSILVNAYVWRELPWAFAMKTPVDYAWIKKSIKTSTFIWLGAVAGAMAASVDRFVVEGHIGREAVGVVSFYGSFVTAVIALMTSGVYSFVYPVLIRLKGEGNKEAFKKEVWHSTLHTIFFSAGICLVLAFVIPWVGTFLNKAELVENKNVFWWLLLGVWIKCIAESFFFVLYAWGEDKLIWMTNFILLAVSLGLNLFFVSTCGLIGIGYSAVLASIFLLIWRAGCVGFAYKRHL